MPTQWQLGQKVWYFSPTYQKYVYATITGVNMELDAERHPILDENGRPRVLVNLDVKNDCNLENVFVDDGESEEA